MIYIPTAQAEAGTQTGTYTIFGQRWPRIHKFIPFVYSWPHHLPASNPASFVTRLYLPVDQLIDLDKDIRV